MDAINGDAQESDDDGDLGQDAGNHIKDLTQPPALEAQLDEMIDCGRDGSDLPVETYEIHHA